MTQDDQKKFLDVIANLDLQIDDATLAAEDAPGVAQTGNLAKAVLLLSNVLLYSPSPNPPLCLCCDRPATIQAADWELCGPCYDAINGPWPGELWGIDDE